MGTVDATGFDEAVCPVSALTVAALPSGATAAGAGADAGVAPLTPVDPGPGASAPDPLGLWSRVLDPSALGGVFHAMAAPLSPAEEQDVWDRLCRTEITGEDRTQALIAVAAGRGVRLSVPTPTPLAVPPDDPPDETAAGTIGSGRTDDWWALALGEAVARVADRLRRLAVDEFENVISDMAREGFLAAGGFTAKAGGGSATRVDGRRPEAVYAYYRRIRAMMYRQNWPDPARYWKDIVPGRLCGVPIEHGVHRAALARLQGPGVDLTGYDNTWGPGGGRVVRTVIGFQPRTIHNKDVLSNHAWGLAIDVNAVDNPDLNDAPVFRVIKRHTTAQIDLGHRVEASNLDEMIDALRQASTDIAAWLTAALPREKELSDAIDKATTDLGRAMAKHDKDATADAVRRLFEATNAYHDDPLELDDVVELRRFIGADGVRRWAGNGFLTLPNRLIHLLEGETRGDRFTWGGEYEHKKDFMHFEIDPRKVLDR